MSPKVAVIGAGPVGLMALKNFKEDGFDVTAFESRPFIGGIWQPCDDDKLSVTDRTIFNSSRFRSAISDFPFPDDTDDFPTWQQMHNYLESYVDHFGLRKYIRLNNRVTNLEREGGNWLVEITPTDGAQPRKEEFDKICVATGTFVQPKQPAFEGIRDFNGRAIHAINFNKPEQYEGQNVLVIGMQASAQDVAVCLDGYARQLYVSHKGGVTMVPRYLSDGTTVDGSQNLSTLLLQVSIFSHFPNVYNWLIDKLVAFVSAKAFPNISPSWRLTPGPSLSVKAPLIADEMYAFMESGFVEPVAEVKRVTGPKSVELTDGRVLNDIDSIIYCTGYDICVPFLPPEFNPYPVVGQPSRLYRNTFPLHPDPEVRDSLAFLGHVAVPFPGFVMHEVLGMAVSQVWLGRSTLPPLADMEDWHKKYLAWREDLMLRHKLQSPFYAMFVPYIDHICWLDEAAGTGLMQHFGWFSRQSWAFWWNENQLQKKIKTGLFSPTIWRLFETGKRKAWPEAREQIFKDDEIAERRKQEYRLRKKIENAAKRSV